MTKEQEILASAEKEFFLKGYDDATTASIAKEAGVTHAMVNYYFRSKENLFIKVLDTHIHSIINSIMPIMTSGKDVLSVFTDTALALFDFFNEDRMFPFILQNTAMSHPEYLLKYRDIFGSTCLKSIKEHTLKLDACIKDGIVSQCSMMDICDTIIALTCSPFLNITMLRNLSPVSEAGIEAYLAGRREEIRRIIVMRYSRAM